VAIEASFFWLAAETASTRPILSLLRQFSRKTQIVVITPSYTLV